MQKLFFILFSFCFLSNLHSQINITGSVTDSLQKPIAGASITLHKGNSNLIIAYAISNTKGGFTILYNNVKTTDTFFVKANAIGYKIKTVQLQSFIQSIGFVLNTTSVLLPNVTVKNPKPFLKYKADTLSYTVDSFTQKQDRTIGDVLRKMPGIDVDGNGRISYNGKAISNFYIDGDNLLDDKYNVATNSIAADMVKDVQVLENHQPIRALKNAAYSDKVAINLNLKDKARLKLTARAELGAGYADKTIYDGTLNIMAFKKKYKAINSLKANNAAKDLATDIVSHNWMDYLKSIQNNVPADMLGLNYPSNPSIGQQRYLFNNAALVNTNNLVRTKNDVQIKLNAYYLYDKQTQDYTNNTFFYLPNDTVKYLQQQNTQNKLNILHTQFNINSNKDKAYWNNTFVVEYNKMPATSLTNFNNKITSQNLQQQSTNISNEFNYIQTKKIKNVVEFYSYFNYLNKPEVLQITPGFNDNFFNNGLPFKLLTQQVNVPTYFTNNYINYRVTSSKILQSYKAGFSSQWQQLQSITQATQTNNSINIISDSFINHLQWKQQKIYAKADYDYLGTRTKISLSIPVNWQYISYSDSATKNNHTVNFNQVFINPSVSIKYATGIESFVLGNYSFGNVVADIENVYGNYILQNYSQLMYNQVPIKQSNVQTASIGYNYRKTIKIFFFNIAAIYSSINNNSIINTQFLNNLQKQSSISLNNTVNSFTLLSGASKYLFKLHTTVNLKASIKSTQWNQLQNNVLAAYINNSYTISGGVTPKINKWLNIAYSGSYTLSNSKPKNASNLLQTVTQMQHSFEANIFANDNLYFKLKADDFYIHQQQLNKINNYFFADASATYKFNKIKTDFVFEVSNLANTNQFSTINISSNSFNQSAFNIRPRMFVLKALFNF